MVLGAPHQPSFSAQNDIIADCHFQVQEDARAAQPLLDRLGQVCWVQPVFLERRCSGEQWQRQ